ncbi:MAG: GSCFA domain-containing protein [Vicinamibacterales bacterium]
MSTEAIRPWPFQVLPSTVVASFGSNVARRLAPFLRQQGFTYVVAESAHPLLPRSVARGAGYGVYSARYGDFYTSRQLLQLLRRADGRFEPVDDVWQGGDGYLDTFRPTIQPGGFATLRELVLERRQHLAAALRVFEQVDVLVVTLRDAGFWTSRADGAAYPVSPDTVLGPGWESRYQYIEPSVADVVSDLTSFLTELHVRNPQARMILTISPGEPGAAHAGTAAYDVLRPAMVELEARDDVAYFPAFELLAGLPFAGGEGGDRDPMDTVLEAFLQTVRATSATAARSAGRRPAPPVASSPAEGDGHQALVDEMKSLVKAVCDEDPRDQPIKCVVWDLDDTVWQGVLLEGDPVQLRPGIEEILATLDRRGIVNSIASRNDPAAAQAKLAEFGIDRYFVFAQINWGSKSASVRKIAELLNVSLDAVAFVDDQPFERDEVAFALPQVHCLDAADVPSMAGMPKLSPRFVTEDARGRRRMYVAEAKRKELEREFSGTSEEYLATLQLRFSIWLAGGDDLERAEELILRTHQLNSTGTRYSRIRLEGFRRSPDHLLLLAGLTDRFGPYGKIGLCLVECGATVWTVKLLLMSCRVMSRGVTSVLLRHVMNQAAAAGVRIQAEFVPTERNQPMFDVFRSAGFAGDANSDGRVLLHAAACTWQPFPPHVQVEVAAEARVDTAV